jgi:SAM-dependent methyltransferase
MERKEQVVREYLSRVSQRAELSEYARGVAFVQLLKDLLLEADPLFLQDYLQGMEHTLPGPKTALYNRGRVDALYGNLVIEFKRSLAKSLDEAREQLRKYVAALQQSPEDRRRPLIAIATDGIQFVAYAPRFSLDATTLTPQDIELVATETADVGAMSPEEVYYWLDRYFVRQTGPIPPRTKQIVADFGPTSGSFIHAMNVLDGLWKSVERDSESQVFFDSWQKYLRITYGGPVADRELFLRHTYLATLAKVMVWVRLTGATEPPAEKELRNVLNGSYFSQRGIHNFLEEDFFAWVARDAAWPQALIMSRRLLLQLATYNLRELSEDVLKGLYEKLVDPKDRHDLGEYYTPDWLAAAIVKECLEANPEASVLDPACGSGTFLYQTILFKRQKLGDLPKTLKHIGECVTGIDIHPLAVIVAKTTYLLGLGDLLEKRGKAIRIPVYLADSVRPPDRYFAGYRAMLNGDTINLPEDLALSPEHYDRAVELCAEYARSTAHESLPSKDLLGNFLRRNYPALVENAVWWNTLYELFQVLRKKIRERKDTIWAFVLKNVFKPLLMKERFDVLVGNPPWLTYKDIERGEYQEYLKNLITHEHGLCEPKLGLLTQLELGTLFFIRGSSLYLKPEGKIAFVLPRSIWSADQHHNLRCGQFSPKLAFWQLWDLEGVNPLFRVPACVFIAGKSADRPEPIPGRSFSGTLPRRNATPDEAQAALKTEQVSFWVAKFGERSYFSTTKKSSAQERSPYYKRFIQGAVIYPRSFWFVKTRPDVGLGLDRDKPYVESAPDAIKKAKKPYQGVSLQGNIEAEFLHGTLLSTDIIPFGFTRMRMVVIPVKGASDGFRLIGPDEASKEGVLGLVEWLERAEERWKEIRGEKALKEGGITHRLDYVRQLTKQRRKTLTVVYPASATYLCACVVSNRERYSDPCSPLVPLECFIAHGETYYWDTDSVEEAMYLCSFLNSAYLDDLLKPMQSRGLFGPRHFHKKPLEMGIQEFDATNPAHRRLAELGAECQQIVANFLSSLPDKVRQGSLGRLRRLIREKLQPQIAEIDSIVSKIL